MYLLSLFCSALCLFVSTAAMDFKAVQQTKEFQNLAQHQRLLEELTEEEYEQKFQIPQAAFYRTAYYYTLAPYWRKLQFHFMPEYKAWKSELTTAIEDLMDFNFELNEGKNKRMDDLKQASEAFFLKLQEVNDKIGNDPAVSLELKEWTDLYGKFTATIRYAAMGGLTGEVPASADNSVQYIMSIDGAYITSFDGAGLPLTEDLMIKISYHLANFWWLVKPLLGFDPNEVLKQFY